MNRTLKYIISILACLIVLIGIFFSGAYYQKQNTSSVVPLIKYKTVSIGGDLGFPVDISFDVPENWSFAYFMDRTKKIDASYNLSVAQSPTFGFGSDNLIFDATNTNQVNADIFIGDIQTDLAKKIQSTSGSVAKTTAQIGEINFDKYSVSAGYPNSAYYITKFSVDNKNYTLLINKQGGDSNFDKNLQHALETLSFRSTSESFLQNH